MNARTKPLTDAPYLSAQAFHNEFELLLRQCKEGFSKWEQRQEYQEPGNVSFERLVDGDVAGAIEALPEVMRQSIGESSIDICRRNLSDVRLRVVERPFSDYLKWEFLTYRISAGYGERILILESQAITEEEEKLPLGDFLLFDSQCVLVHDYDRSGLLRGGWHVNRSSDVHAYKERFEKALSASVPLAEFEYLHHDELQLSAKDNHL